MIRLKKGQLLAQVNTESGEFAIQIKCFNTHMAVSENKTKRDRFVKVGGNSIFSGSLNRFARAHAVRSMHAELLPGVELLKQALFQAGILPDKYRWKVRMIFRVHAGYGSIGMRKTKKGWVISGGEDVTLERANWDIDNQWIWQKVFKDVCVKNDLLGTDTVARIAGDAKDFIEVPTFDQRSLTFVFHRA
jgi:hypothetical protein